MSNFTDAFILILFAHYLFDSTPGMPWWVIGLVVLGIVAEVHAAILRATEEE